MSVRITTLWRLCRLLLHGQKSGHGESTGELQTNQDYKLTML